MHVVTEVKLNDEGFGKFYISENGQEIAFMEVSISDNYLTAYHTEVVPEANGRGLAKELFNFMVGYARDKNVKVIPLCVFVHTQFKRNPSVFEDIWEQNYS